jgi:hypothetical protein
MTIQHMLGTGAIAITVMLSTAGSAGAQQKTKLAYTRPANMSNYTQQHRVDVGDVAGHQLRVFELKGIYPETVVSFAGEAVREEYHRGLSDYVDDTGHHFGYSEYLLKNGDKVFGRFDGTSQRVKAADGSATSSFLGVISITGGTGKLRSIRGVLRYSGVADHAKNSNEERIDGEYWLGE